MVENGEIISYQSFFLKYGEKADSMLIYNTIFNGLLRHTDQIKSEYDKEIVSDITPVPLFRDHECGKIERKVFLKMLNDNLTESVKTSWREQYDINKNDKNVWLMAFETVTETKLLELQYKILHNIYPTAVLLTKMKIKYSDLCNSCGEIETLEHFFVKCNTAKVLWTEAEKIVSISLGKTFTFTERLILFGILSHEEEFNLNQRKFINKVNLITKISISKFKFKNEGNIKLLFENQLRFRGISF